MLIWLLLAASFLLLLYLAALIDDELQKVKHEYAVLKKVVDTLYEEFVLLSLRCVKYKNQNDHRCELLEQKFKNHQYAISLLREDVNSSVKKIHRLPPYKGRNF